MTSRTQPQAPMTAQQHKAALAKMITGFGYRHDKWQVFRDFVAMAALAISNSVDKSQFEDREAQYMQIVARYSKEEVMQLAGGLANVVLALEEEPQDVLGSLFMSLELGNSWKGQFFTPYELSYLMAKMTTGPQARADIERRGFFSVNDPCIGGGAMLIAAAHALRDEGINYQKHMHAVAADIDLCAVHMAYIQLSLLHVPAVVYHANSISMEVWSAWKTPAHVLGLWDVKLGRDASAKRLPLMLEALRDAAPAPAPTPAQDVAAPPPTSLPAEADQPDSPVDADESAAMAMPALPSSAAIHQMPLF